MPTIGSITKTIRINPSDLEIIEKIMADGTSWSGAIHKLIEGCTQTPKESSNPEMEKMAGLFHITVEEMMAGILAGLDSGSLTVESGKVKGVPEYSLDNFLDACHDLNLDPQKTLDKVAGMIRKGAV